MFNSRWEDDDSYSSKLYILNIFPFIRLLIHRSVIDVASIFVHRWWIRQCLSLCSFSMWETRM